MGCPGLHYREGQGYPAVIEGTTGLDLGKWLFWAFRWFEGKSRRLRSSLDDICRVRSINDGIAQEQRESG
jgi:hypothetical protein